MNKFRFGAIYNGRLWEKELGVSALFVEHGDILRQLPGGQKAFQSTLYHTVSLQMLQIRELFQNYSELEQSIFLKDSNTLIPAAAHGQI